MQKIWLSRRTKKEPPIGLVLDDSHEILIECVTIRVHYAGKQKTIRMPVTREASLKLKASIHSKAFSISPILIAKRWLKLLLFPSKVTLIRGPTPRVWC